MDITYLHINQGYGYTTTVGYTRYQRMPIAPWPRPKGTTHWDIVETDGKYKVFVTCVFCGKILSADDRPISAIGQVGKTSGSCVQCDACGRHIWVLLDGWTPNDQKLLRLRKRKRRKSGTP